jgi:hypothetical protein|tara:strand:- start:28439 stop:29134 length:696 start_codon:yes stop_codon:yes gene_type:complete
MPVRSAATTYVGTLDGHGPEAWTDLSPHSLFKDPNIIIPAAEVTLYSEDQDRQDLYLRERKVIYTEVVAGVTYKYLLNLTFFVNPGAALTVSATVGKLIGEDGAVTAAADTHTTVAGLSLGKYFTVGVDSFGETAIGPYGESSYSADAFVSTTIPTGAAVWLVRSGTAVVDCSGAITAGVEAKANTGGALQATAGAADVPALLLGTARVDPGGAALGIIDLRMPERLPPLS